MIFINFKTYPKGSDQNALDLIQILENVSQETSIKIIPVVQIADLKQTTQITRLEVWVQHIDPIDFGAHTGSILPEAVVQDGAAGTFLNHSEKKFSSFKDLSKAASRAKKLSLKTLIFASNINEFKQILALKPDFAAYEPPELIGSTTKSVTSEKPGAISQAATLAKSQSIPLIVGAGIHSSQDIHKSLELGATGFAVASDIMKATNPKKQLLELIEGYQ